MIGSVLIDSQEIVLPSSTEASQVMEEAVVDSLCLYIVNTGCSTLTHFIGR